jgi:ATP phosphoribosyltransferase
MVEESPSRIRVALPRGAELLRLVDQFGRAGFDLADLKNGSELLNAGDPLNSGFEFEFVKLSPADVGTYVEYGICHAGVLSTDLIGEREVNVWRPFTFNFGSYPLVLAAMKGQNLETLLTKPVLRPATSIPRFAKQWFTVRGIPTEIVEVVESSATAVVLGLADCWVDRLTNPERVVAEGFRVVEAMGRSYLKLVVNPAAASRRRAAIRVLIKALEENKLEPPPPIDIPFDLEDPV